MDFRVRESTQCKWPPTKVQASKHMTSARQPQGLKFTLLAQSTWIIKLDITSLAPSSKTIFLLGREWGGSHRLIILGIKRLILRLMKYWVISTKLLRPIKAECFHSEHLEMPTQEFTVKAESHMIEIFLDLEHTRFLKRLMKERKYRCTRRSLENLTSTLPQLPQDLAHTIIVWKITMETLYYPTTGIEGLLSCTCPLNRQLVAEIWWKVGRKIILDLACTHQLTLF